MPLDVSSVIRDQMRARFSAHVAAMRQPRTFLQTVAFVALTIAIALILLVVLLVALVVAIPAGLILLAWLWFRSLLPTRRHDGRKNVRVINGPASNA